MMPGVPIGLRAVASRHRAEAAERPPSSSRGAVFTTAPKPVMTPQPIIAASSSGMSLRILTMGVLVHQHLLGEGRQIEKLVQLLRGAP